MQIENPQIKLGLRHIVSGTIILLNGLMPYLVDPNEKDPYPQPEDMQPAKKGRKSKAETSEPAPAAAVTGSAAPAGPAPTHDTLRNAIQAFVALPGSGGIDAAKKIVLEPHGASKITQLNPEQLATAHAAITKAAEAAQGVGEL